MTISTPRTAEAGRKILNLAEAGTQLEDYRRNGFRIVLCHGTFDLLHIGHIKHFEAARKFGDVLIVTITADRHIRKGVGRPAFPEQLRAEMIATLELVDLVGIVDDPSAIPALNAVKPDFYVKGSDYRDPADDVTNKIGLERDAVEAHGGELVFTDEVTYSSSSLLNAHFGLIDPAVKEHLEQRAAVAPGRTVKEAFDRAGQSRILFIGEPIIDEYVHVDTLGKAAKESIIATRYLDRALYAGGVVAAANHVASFCDQVSVVTAFGANDPHNGAVIEKLRPGIQLNALKLEDRPTVRKTRFVDRSYKRKLFEVYTMDDRPMASAEEEDLLARLDAELALADIVIVTDFGHGLISPRAVDMLTEKSKFLAVNVQTNSGNRGFNLITKYPRADFLCIDEPELRLACGDKHRSVEDLMLNTLPNLIDADLAIVTHGRDGCYIKGDKDRVERVPALTQKVVDTVGAGDAFLSFSAPMAANGIAVHDIAMVGNIAGALKVDIYGHSESVTLANVLKYYETLFK